MEIKEAAAVAGSAANAMTRYLISIAIGAVLGSLTGYYGQCNSGACPLTSTWWRGAIYGGVMGLLFAFSSHR